MSIDVKKVNLLAEIDLFWQCICINSDIFQSHKSSHLYFQFSPTKTPCCVITAYT